MGPLLDLIILTSEVALGELIIFLWESSPSLHKGSFGKSNCSISVFSKTLSIEGFDLSKVEL